MVANILWFVLAGFWLFVGYAFAALLCFIFIVTIPFGVAALRIALFAVWPFGRAVVPQAGKGVGSTLGNILWFVLGGWYLALLHLITGVLLGSRRLEFERHQDGLGSALRRARRGRWSSWRPRSAGNALVSAGESLS